LKLATGWKIEEKDTSDDRLARVVEELGKQDSENFANSQLRGLEQRLKAAENALLKLAAKPGKDLVQLDEKIEINYILYILKSWTS
jgi:hypothetical protein